MLPAVVSTVSQQTIGIGGEHRHHLLAPKQRIATALLSTTAMTPHCVYSASPPNPPLQLLAFKRQAGGEAMHVACTLAYPRAATHFCAWAVSHRKQRPFAATTYCRSQAENKQIELIPRMISLCCRPVTSHFVRKKPTVPLNSSSVTDHTRTEITKPGRKRVRRMNCATNARHAHTQTKHTQQTKHTLTHTLPTHIHSLTHSLSTHERGGHEQV